MNSVNLKSENPEKGKKEGELFSLIAKDRQKRKNIQIEKHQRPEPEGRRRNTNAKKERKKRHRCQNGVPPAVECGRSEGS